MITITLYRYEGRNNVLNKTSGLNNISYDIQGVLRNPTSLLRPTIDIDVSDLTTAQQNYALILSNFVKIHQFSRYYFVTNRVYVSDKIVRLFLEVDVLHSFHLDVTSYNVISGFVERSTSDYDVMQVDSMIPFIPDKKIVESEITDVGAGSEKNTTFSATLVSNAKKFYIQVGSSSGWSMSIPSKDDLPAVETSNFLDATGSVGYCCDLSVLQATANRIIGDNSNLASFFKSFVAYPFDISGESIGSATDLYINTYDPGSDSYVYRDIGLGQNYYSMPTMSKRKIIADFNMPTASNFMDYDPYCIYELFIPFYGWTKLDYTYLSGHRLQVIYEIDYGTGKANASIYDKTGKSIIWTKTIQLGVVLPLSYSNKEQLENQMNAMQNNLALSLVSSAIGMISSIGMHNVVGAVGSGMQAVNAIVSYNNQSAMMYEQLHTTANGSVGSAYQFMKVRLRITRTKTSNEYDGTGLANSCGRPLNCVKSISSLSGFVKMRNVTGLHMDIAMKEEKDMMLEHLAKGVYITN